MSRTGGDSSTPRLTRREALRALGVGAATAVLASCGPVSGAPSVSSTPATTTPKSGGTLRVGMAGDLARLNAQRVTPTTLDTIFSCTDALTRYDDKLQPQPVLAESFDVTSDLRTFKFVLRKGVQFHNGRELTSEDIKQNLLWVRDPKSQALQFAAQSAWWTGIETPDKYTIILRSEQTRAAAFDFFEQLNIIDTVTAQGPDGATKLVGTGPFAFQEWVTGDHIRMVKNKNYWQSGRPYLDEVYVQVTSDVQATAVQLEAGALQAALAMPPREQARLGKNPKYTVVRNPVGGQYFALVLNTTYGPLKDKRVRQAINYTIDRKRFEDAVLLNSSDLRVLPWPKHSPAYDAALNASLSQDLDKAKSLLAQAGLSDGVDLELSHVSTDFEPGQLAQIVQADAAKVGLRFKIVQYEQATYSDVLAKLAYKGPFARYSGYGSLEPVSLFNTSTYWRPTDGVTGFKTDQYSQLIDQAGKEPDAAKRKRIYDQMNQLILDEAFTLALAGQEFAVITAANVHGVRRSPRDSTDWIGVWIE